MEIKEKNKDSNPKNMKKSRMETSPSKDIRSFFTYHGKVSNTKKERCSTKDVVQLSDED